MFLELDVNSLVCFLAFDNNAINYILRDENAGYFSKEFPIFYRNHDGKSAIDTALEENQIRSVNTMIDYICKYQNYWVYSNLFHNNIVSLLKKGVTMERLFTSNVFRMHIMSE